MGSLGCRLVFLSFLRKTSGLATFGLIYLPVSVHDEERV
jgi:hypothetical protein